MVMDVVWWHGAYRSLNNRHLMALKQAGAPKCRVRCWPLAAGLKLLCDKTRRCVVHKFVEARSNLGSGLVARVRPASACSMDGDDAIRPEDSLSHAGADVDACDAQSHFFDNVASCLSRVSFPSMVSAASWMHSNGEHRCYLGECLFWDQTDNKVAASELQQFSWVCAANGQMVRVMSVKRHPLEQRRLVDFCRRQFLTTNFKNIFGGREGRFSTFRICIRWFSVGKSIPCILGHFGSRTVARTVWLEVGCFRIC